MSFRLSSLAALASCRGRKLDLKSPRSVWWISPFSKNLLRRGNQWVPIPIPRKPSPLPPRHVCSYPANTVSAPGRCYTACPPPRGSYRILRRGPEYIAKTSTAAASMVQFNFTGWTQIDRLPENACGRFPARNKADRVSVLTLGFRLHLVATRTTFDQTRSQPSGHSLERIKTWLIWIAV